LGFFDLSGLAITKDSNDKCGVINSAMKTVLPAKYLSIDIQHKRYIKAEISDWRFRLFNKSGVQMLPFEFSKIVFSEDNPDFILVFSESDVVAVYKWDAKLNKLVLKRKHESAGKMAFVNLKSYSVTYHYTLETTTYDLETGKLSSKSGKSDNMFGDDYYGDMAPNVDVVGMDEYSERKNPVPFKYVYRDTMSLNVVYEMQRDNYHNKNLKHVRLNKKWGVVSLDRKVIVPLIYDTIINCYSYSYYTTKDNDKVLGWVCRLNGQYGLVSTDASRNLPFQYQDIEFFSAKFIMVKQNSKYGVLEHSGRQVIPCEVDSFKYGFSESLDWTTCSDELILMAIKNGKIALYGTKGGKTDYLFDKEEDMYTDKSNPYGYTRSVKLKSGDLYGMALCNSKGFIYVPCRYKQLYYYMDCGYYKYYKISTLNNQSGYIDNLGRKFFEE
jgi:hypothetical protein